MTLAAIGLGSNLGDRRRHLRGAVGGLAHLGRVVAVSSLYETAPVGISDQGDYLNAVVVVDTELRPQALLEELLALEREAGRERRERWEPRTLDLDLLLYGGLELAGGELAVPHPRLAERRFALEPLVEAWPEGRLPDGRAVADLLQGVRAQPVRRIEDPGWMGPELSN